MGLYFLHCDSARSACQSSLFVLAIDVEECHAISQNMKRGPEGPLSHSDQKITGLLRWCCPEAHQHFHGNRCPR